MTLFETTVATLELEDAYNSAREYLGDHETLTRILSTLGVSGLLDNGNVLDSSMSNPKRFLEFTDALYDYLNNHLDTVPGAPEILAQLLNTQVVSVDSFVPSLNVSPNREPSRVDVTFTGVGLTFSLFGSEVDPLNDPDGGDVIDLADGILMEPGRYTYLGRLTIYEDSRVVWSATDEAPTSTARDLEVTLPTSIDLEEVVRDEVQ